MAERLDFLDDERALATLGSGGYMTSDELAGARKVLNAAAMTYVSASLMSLLNIARWWAILRR